MERTIYVRITLFDQIILKTYLTCQYYFLKKKKEILLEFAIFAEML